MQIKTTRITNITIYYYKVFCMLIIKLNTHKKTGNFYNLKHLKNFILM